jgi:hypothetical protein
MTLQELKESLGVNESEVLAILAENELSIEEVKPHMIGAFKKSLAAPLASTNQPPASGGGLATTSPGKVTRKSGKNGREVLASRTAQEVTPVTNGSIDYEAVARQSVAIGFDAGMNVAAVAAEGFQQGFNEAIVEGAGFTAEFREGLHKQGVDAILGILSA